MFEVDFIFTGGTVLNTALPMEAINAIKESLDEGKSVNIAVGNTTAVVFPQNLVMIQVNTKPIR